MPRRAGGRPKREEGESGTRQVRVFEDMADKISEILEVQGGSTANLLDPLIRTQINALHKKLEPEILEIRKAKEALAKAREKAARKHREGDRAG